MSEDAPAANPRSNPWKRRSNQVRIAPEEAARQGAITQLAFLTLGRERAIAFLNTSHDSLGGRPLELATRSEEGRGRVEAEISRMTQAPMGGEG